MRMRFLIGVAIIAALGCAGKKYAPVSGRVTLNGQPLANATVNFQPIAGEGKIEAGPGSTAKTNEKGEFVLTVDTGEKGAVVGKHRVVISALNPVVGEGDERRRGGPELADKVPYRYSIGQKDELRFEVPAAGTDKADFALTSP